VQPTRRDPEEAVDTGSVDDLGPAEDTPETVNPNDPGG
jgi:hypothetical protein